MVTSTVLAVVVYTIYYGVYRYYSSLLRESSSADTAGAVESTDQAEESKTGEGEEHLIPLHDDDFAGDEESAEDDRGAEDIHRISKASSSKE